MHTFSVLVAAIAELSASFFNALVGVVARALATARGKSATLRYGSCVSTHSAKTKLNKALEAESYDHDEMRTARYDCHLRNIKLQEKIKMAKIQDKDSGFSSADQSRLGVNGQELDDLPWLSGCMAWGLTEADESKDDGSYLWWMIAKQNDYHVKVEKDPSKEDSQKIIGFGKAEEFGHMVLSSGLTGSFPDIDNAIKLLPNPAEQYNFAIDALIDHYYGNIPEVWSETPKELNGEIRGPSRRLDIYESYNHNEMHANIRNGHRTRQLAAEFIERTGRSKDSPSEVVNGICDLLHNAFNIGDHGPLDGCEYNYSRVAWLGSGISTVPAPALVTR